ncbi:MAG: ATP-binding protein [Colwellia sp.]|nr:ATP-binding protein [Colwellia sp.]
MQEKLQQVHGNRSYSRLLNQLSNSQILLLDYWGMVPLTDQQRNDQLDVIDVRHEQSSMKLMSQLPVSKWHELIGEVTCADAIMDGSIKHRDSNLKVNQCEKYKQLP